MANKTTESELGFLGKLVTQLYTKKAEKMLEEIEEGMDPNVAVDVRAVQSIAKWVLDNGIYAAPDADDEASPLAARLQEIRDRSKGRVIDFKKEASDRGQG